MCPAVDAAVPLPIAFAADGAVEPDVRRDDAAVGLEPLHPRVDVLESPVPVPLLPGEHVGVQGQRGRAQVERMVACDVVVVLEVLQHLLVARLAVQRSEAPLDLDRIARPVDRRRLAQHRAPAAVEHAADQLPLRVVVVGDRVVAHVEACEAPGAGDQLAVVRAGQALEHEGGQPLAGVHPVEHHGELFEVHAVAGERHIDGLGLGVLPDVAVPGAFVQLQHHVGSAQGVQRRPVGEVLGGVVRTVVARPARNTEEIAALVEVVLEELLAGAALGADELALQQRPPGRRHRRGYGDGRPTGHGAPQA